MNYVLLTASENISIPITESIKLWKHEKFDPKKRVVVMVTGWTTDIDEENTAASVLWAAYEARGDTNFVLIDTARYVDTLYAWSAFNTQELGEGLGKGLAELAEVVPLDRIHLMGHSLGFVYQLLPRITSNNFVSQALILQVPQERHSNKSQAKCYFESLALIRQR